MNPTSVIRRVDHLGRITIPKNIREAFDIQEDDPFEVYTNDKNEIIFKKLAIKRSDNSERICEKEYPLNPDRSEEQKGYEHD